MFCVVLEGHSRSLRCPPFIEKEIGDPVLTAYCDSDWLGCPYTRRSRTGYLLLLGGTHISLRTKKQSVVSRSSAEAEYRAMASTVANIVEWLVRRIFDVHVRDIVNIAYMLEEDAPTNIVE
ncbi:uncharacterized mitochondrial protein-like protein [Tanacetum coccineum]